MQEAPPTGAPAGSQPSGDELKALNLFAEGAKELRGGSSVSKAVKILTDAHAIAPENVEIAGALWEAERELAAVLFDMARTLKADGREAEAGKNEMRAKLAEDRAAKLDAMSAQSEWRLEQERAAAAAAAEEEEPPPKSARTLDDISPSLRRVTVQTGRAVMLLGALLRKTPAALQTGCCTSSR
eukprot:1096211-Prymnesium_polylepis.2